MKLQILFGSADSTAGKAWDDTVELIVEADRMGIDTAWSAEAWGLDAVSPLAYLAAKTERIKLGTGIMQISARTPSMTAMTAMTMAAITGDRFVLGLGASGPQVVEGLHGVEFARPMTRMRETIEIVRLAFRGEKLEFHGKHHELPRPGGEGKPLRLTHPANPNIPVHLATLSPRALALTGELADGWLGTCVIPEHMDQFTQYLAEGAARAGRSVDDIALSVTTGIQFGDDVERILAAQRPYFAFRLGGMGSAKTNFYNDAFKRSGFREEATRVQALWHEGKREQAAAAVPDDLMLKSSFVGTDEMILERLRMFAKAGLKAVCVAPGGRSAKQKIETMAHLHDLVQEAS